MDDIAFDRPDVRRHFRDQLGLVGYKPHARHARDLIDGGAAALFGERIGRKPDIAPRHLDLGLVQHRLLECRRGAGVQVLLHRQGSGPSRRHPQRGQRDQPGPPFPYPIGKLAHSHPLREI
jgi:hypothetical protein